MINFKKLLKNYFNKPVPNKSDSNLAITMIIDDKFESNGIKLLSDNQNKLLKD
jgi:hypothetical protein